MSIEERLGEIDLSIVSSEKAGPKGTASLQMDNFAVLLVQGLESNDTNILSVSVVFREGLVSEEHYAIIIDKSLQNFRKCCLILKSLPCTWNLTTY